MRLRQARAWLSRPTRWSSGLVALSLACVAGSSATVGVTRAARLAASGAPRLIASDVGSEPFISSNGKFVVFTKFRLDQVRGPYPVYIWGGRSVRQIAPDGHPAGVTNDGREVAYTCGETTLCIKQVDAGTVRRIRRGAVTHGPQRT